MDIDPRRLRVLHEVARRGGVVRAAAALHLTPSAVSQQLARLEREVGLRLLDRSGGRAGLTPAGRVLAARAARVEEELAEARRELQRFTGVLEGPVVVGAFMTAIRHLLVPAFRALAVRHERIAPTVREVEGEAALRELRLGGLDLLITERDASPLPPADLLAVRVHDDEYRVVAPPGRPVPRTVAELADLPWVAGSPGEASGQALDRLARAHGFTPRRVHYCTEFPAVFALVAAGHGVAIAPSLALLDVAEGEVAVSPIRGIGTRRIEALTRPSRTRGSTPDPIPAAVIAALRDAAGALPAA
ncbi:LysR family transcriptional regulator [Bailinhaonella thermotolerans]|uniref:LysR family transcriptional regulator n=1 Tax=Bailinhaonella thermotolerans TaxID=1070861 RepID=A0A3A4B3D7_9ACTN|nr:LysR family transcriptional regulator [Bailinhaonella thermotolerans]RJL32549.1 LysR family transcriptional regulator [Bailinhaonella thermotolerans]